jgi:type II secretory pathway pseudopilin PulG
VKTKRSGLTVIEILVVVGIIATLVAILVPAMSMVKNTAKEVKQKAQFTAIELGLAAFRNDTGDYPPSDWWNPAVPAAPQDYCGAQKLAEAMVGWDLLGFHPDSAWRADGLDSLAGPGTYDPLKVNAPSVTLQKRKGRYVELEVANAFKLGETLPGARDGLFVDTAPLARNTYVLCDVFEVPERKIRLASGRMVAPGTPILYYRANPANKTISQPALPENRTYNLRDNLPLIGLGRLADAAQPAGSRRVHPLHPLAPVDPRLPSPIDFYDYIRDPKIEAQPWPYKPDSYILISAGPDGLYGTSDDLCNFAKK